MLMIQRVREIYFLGKKCSLSQYLLGDHSFKHFEKKNQNVTDKNKGLNENPNKSFSLVLKNHYHSTAIIQGFTKYINTHSHPNRRLCYHYAMLNCFVIFLSQFKDPSFE